MNASFFTSPTLWLILANVGVWVFLGLQGVGWTSPTPDDLTAWGGNLGPYTLTGEWRRLFQAMFLHAGALHLALNMFLLSQIGPISEALWGRTRFVLIYLLTGLSGGLLSAWWYAQTALRSLERTHLQMAFGVEPTLMTTVSVGASGALMGVAGALLMHALHAGVDDGQGHVAHREPGKHVAENPQARVELKIVAQVVLLNIGMGFLVDGTDNAAHVGGAVAGMVVAALLLMPGERLRIGRALQSAFVFAAGLLALGFLATRPASNDVVEIAEGMRAATLEKARLAAQRAKREQAERVGQAERAALPAPVSIEAAAGASASFAGSFSGEAFVGAADAWYAADRSSNRIARLRPTQLKLERQWTGPPLPVDDESGCTDNWCRGIGAAGVAPARDGSWAVVGSMVPDAVSRIDLATGKVQWSVPVERYPRTVFLGDSEQYAFAVHGPRNILSVIDVAQRKLLLSTPVGEGSASFPFGRYIGAAQGRGILYLADPQDNAIYTIDTENPDKPRRIASTGELTPYLLALSGDGGKLFVSGPGGMQVFDARTHERTDEFLTCARNAVPEFAVDGDGSRVALLFPDEHQVRIVSTVSQRTVRVLPASEGANAMRFAGDGKSLYVLGSAGAEKPVTVLTRLDLSRTLDLAATVDAQGEYFCFPQEAQATAPLDLYRGLMSRGLLDGLE